MKGVEQAIADGLAYIAQAQDNDGGFTSFSSPSLAPFQPLHKYQTTFVPSLILSSLSLCPAAVLIRQRLAEFLQSQKSDAWTYNYWQTTSPQRQTLAYPDDLDDTFCALSALAIHDPALADEGMLAAAVKILIAAESRPGGPYRTWLVAPDSDPVWLDVDLAVNSNIAYFLSIASEPLPSLVDFIDTTLLRGEVFSPYYPSSLPLLYFIARGYAGQQQTLLIKTIRAAQLKAATSLDQALLLSALLRLGDNAGLQKIITGLLKAQAADGSWPAAAFCIDPAREGKIFYHGSAALSTAFVVEALCLHELARHAKQPAQQHSSDLTARRILKLANQTDRDLPASIRGDLRDFVKRVATGSSGAEITGLPELFNKSLISPIKDQAARLDDLALANLYGWSAYTIYDDFLDNEGVGQLLPVANVALRRCLEIFQNALDKKFVTKTFNTIEAANAWELRHCRYRVERHYVWLADPPAFGNLQKLAERSVGHLLAPMAILELAGYSVTSTQAEHLHKALRHYLIARQLNDDMHDWEEDIRRGSITYVVASILTALKIKPGKQPLDKLIPLMKKQFWHQTMAETCQTMLRQISMCRRDLAASGLVRRQSPLESLLDDLEASVQKTLQTQAQAESFLKHYGSKN